MIEFIGWFIAFFGCACFSFGIVIGYAWGKGNGYNAGRKAGEGACEARHLGKLGDPK